MGRVRCGGGYPVIVQSLSGVEFWKYRCGKVRTSVRICL